MYRFVRIRNNIFAEWHMRSLHLELDIKAKKGKAKAKAPLDGLRVSREMGYISPSDWRQSCRVDEKRNSIYLISSPTSHLPPFRIICLSDSDDSFDDYSMSGSTGCFAGISKYIAMIYGTIVSWGKQSENFLGQIDQLARASVSGKNDIIQKVILTDRLDWGYPGSSGEK
jgi:hypothetical protein